MRPTPLPALSLRRRIMAARTRWSWRRWAAKGVVAAACVLIALGAGLVVGSLAALIYYAVSWGLS